ncbi:DUF2939 domain-containing protein [Aurantiacibacter gangjinensis]|uniref:Uncharacterized protein n=1 Tax=Aurantiacibacter gangjinensis TaxID=502682 RepID=A0A0G9MR45_9SPHN|nr:DUF2939 domain-containing protein [Aurantiacibacter gangjinensis]APE29119.1 hypothetical protein BMF35_a2290 [Aurantiacibacter gangjinensis]KLE33201.1 hypothetical protein AAW01_04330 [Aurantiacibacter gangjinensis]
MKKLLALIILIALAFGGWYFASPWLAMRSLADAAQAQDVAALEEKVDFPAFRASASDQLTTVAREQGGPLGELGGALAERFGGDLIDRAVTPENVGNLVASGALIGGLVPERLRTQELGWDVERDGLDHFRAVGTFEDGTAGPILLFRRDGLGWKLTGFELVRTLSF